MAYDPSPLTLSRASIEDLRDALQLWYDAAADMRARDEQLLAKSRTQTGQLRKPVSPELAAQAYRSAFELFQGDYE